MNEEALKDALSIEFIDPSDSIAQLFVAQTLYAKGKSHQALQYFMRGYKSLSKNDS